MLRRLQRSVSQPARRQGEQTESDEGPGRKANKLRIASAEEGFQRHHGGVDQHHKVIECVRPIEKADGNAPPRQAEERAVSGKRFRGSDFGGHWSIPDSREAPLISA